MMEPVSKTPTWSRFGQKLNQNSQSEILAIPMRIQARQDATRTARLLGFAPNDIPVLIAAKMLRPLGKPVPNSTKYFATCYIEALAQDTDWLDAATQIIYDHWRGKNDRKTVNALRTQTATPEAVLAE